MSEPTPRLTRDHPCLAVVSPPASPLLVYADDFLTTRGRTSLEAFLASCPDDADDVGRGPGSTNAFVFRRPRVNGITVTTRWEAAVGDPVWTGSGLGRGPDLPPLLAQLAAEVRDALSFAPGLPDTRFTSAYVDRYEAGGSFFPHTDRSEYGAVVAGVSLGASSARLVFENEPQTTSWAVEVEPGSLYAFTGVIRTSWRHRVDGVTGRRWSVTFRGAGAR